MSVRTMARVWAESKHGGTDLLVLLAIADFADDDGNAYPSVPTLATKCRMSVRNTNYILSTIQRSGELEVRVNEGPRGTNCYRITLRDTAKGLKPASGGGVKPASGVKATSGGLKATSSPPEAHFPKPLKPTSDEPSLNHQEPERARSALRSSAVRGTRLPESWSPSAADIAYCRAKRPDLDPTDIAEAFRLYWRAATGKTAAKADWSAAWKTWIRNERRSTGSGSVLHSDDVFEATR